MKEVRTTYHRHVSYGRSFQVGDLVETAQGALGFVESTGDEGALLAPLLGGSGGGEADLCDVVYLERAGQVLVGQNPHALWVKRP